MYGAIAFGARSRRPALFQFVHPSGGLLGPFNALLVSPQLGLVVQGIGGALRSNVSLPASVREIAILVVARDWQAEYEWYAHSSVARSLGIHEELIEALGCGQRPRELNDGEEVAYDVCTALSTGVPLDNDLYDRATVLLGEKGVAELGIVWGYYVLLGGLLRIFGEHPRVRPRDTSSLSERAFGPLPFPMRCGGGAQ